MLYFVLLHFILHACCFRDFYQIKYVYTYICIGQSWIEEFELAWHQIHTSAEECYHLIRLINDCSKIQAFLCSFTLVGDYTEKIKPPPTKKKPKTNEEAYIREQYVSQLFFYHTDSYSQCDIWSTEYYTPCSVSGYLHKNWLSAY